MILITRIDIVRWIQLFGSIYLIFLLWYCRMLEGIWVSVRISHPEIPGTPNDGHRAVPSLQCWPSGNQTWQWKIPHTWMFSGNIIYQWRIFLLPHVQLSKHFQGLKTWHGLDFPWTSGITLQWPTGGRFPQDEPPSILGHGIHISIIFNIHTTNIPLVIHDIPSTPASHHHNILSLDMRKKCIKNLDNYFTLISMYGCLEDKQTRRQKLASPLTHRGCYRKRPPDQVDATHFVAQSLEPSPVWLGLCSFSGSYLDTCHERYYQ